MKCPKCREEMPVLSKICPVCGYTVENEEGGESPIDFVHKMEGILLDVKNLPQPTFFRSMGQLSFIMMPIIALFMLAFAIVSEAGLFWILFLLFLILAIVAIVRKARGRLGNDRANTEFAELKNEMEYNRRIATHSYGKNTEVRKVMNEIEVELAKVERARKGASGRNVAIWIAILIVIFAAAGLGVFKMDRALNPDNTTGILGEAAAVVGASSSDVLQKAVDKVRAMSDSDSGVEQARIDLTAELLNAGETTKAEEFFLADVMGRMKDFDCAELIVKHYVKAGQKAEAEAFVSKCTGMRYGSDKGKLSGLIK